MLAVTRTWPELAHFVESLDRCDYRGFMQSLVDAEPQWRRDRFFAPHVYALRELRIKAYRQLLQSYRSDARVDGGELRSPGPRPRALAVHRFGAAQRQGRQGGADRRDAPTGRQEQAVPASSRTATLLNRIGKFARAINDGREGEMGCKKWRRAGRGGGAGTRPPRAGRRAPFEARRGRRTRPCRFCRSLCLLRSLTSCRRAAAAATAVSTPPPPPRRASPPPSPRARAPRGPPPRRGI